MSYLHSKSLRKINKIISSFLIFTFISTMIIPPSQAQSISLPVPGTTIGLTPNFTPAIIRGIMVHPDDSLKFDFVIDKGDSKLNDKEFQAETKKLIKYFLASLTVPEKEMWVNLSPYEKDRVIPSDFGKTEMGQDLLAQDYLLKQLTASLMIPEGKVGSEFWKRVRAKAQEKFGTQDIQLNTFNKIWIVPQAAHIYENEKGAFVTQSHLKVMLEEDYLALDANKNSAEHGLGNVKKEELKPLTELQTQIIREVLIPEIEKEVNDGKTFSNLRQIYNSMILASWYKKALKESLLGQVYVDQHKIKGVEAQDEKVVEQIYKRYVDAFKKGVYDYIKEDYDPKTQKLTSRKYFSGGIVGVDYAQLAPSSAQEMFNLTQTMGVTARATVSFTAPSAPTTITPSIDAAMTTEDMQKYPDTLITVMEHAATAHGLSQGNDANNPATARYQALNDKIVTVLSLLDAADKFEFAKSALESMNTKLDPKNGLNELIGEGGVKKYSEYRDKLQAIVKAHEQRIAKEFKDRAVAFRQRPAEIQRFPIERTMERIIDTYPDTTYQLEKDGRGRWVLGLAPRSKGNSTLSLVMDPSSAAWEMHTFEGFGRNHHLSWNGSSFHYESGYSFDFHAPSSEKPLVDVFIRPKKPTIIVMEDADAQSIREGLEFEGMSNYMGGYVIKTLKEAKGKKDELDFLIIAKSDFDKDPDRASYVDAAMLPSVEQATTKVVGDQPLSIRVQKKYARGEQGNTTTEITFIRPTNGSQPLTISMNRPLSESPTRLATVLAEYIDTKIDLTANPNDYSRLPSLAHEYVDAAMRASDEQLAAFRIVLGELRASTSPDMHILVKEIPVNLDAKEKEALKARFLPVAEELSETLRIETAPGQPKGYEVVVTDNAIGLNFIPEIAEESTSGSGKELAVMIMKSMIEGALGRQQAAQDAEQDIELTSQKGGVWKKPDSAMLDQSVDAAMLKTPGVAEYLGYILDLQANEVPLPASITKISNIKYLLNKTKQHKEKLLAALSELAREHSESLVNPRFEDVDYIHALALSTIAEDNESVDLIFEIENEISHFLNKDRFYQVLSPRRMKALLTSKADRKLVVTALRYIKANMGSMTDRDFKTLTADIIKSTDAAMISDDENEIPLTLEPEGAEASSDPEMEQKKRELTDSLRAFNAYIERLSAITYLRDDEKQQVAFAKAQARGIGLNLGQTRAEIDRQLSSILRLEEGLSRMRTIASPEGKTGGMTSGTGRSQGMDLDRYDRRSTDSAMLTRNDRLIWETVGLNPISDASKLASLTGLSEQETQNTLDYLVGIGEIDTFQRGGKTYYRNSAMLSPEVREWVRMADRKGFDRLDTYLQTLPEGTQVPESVRRAATIQDENGNFRIASTANPAMLAGYDMNILLDNVRADAFARHLAGLREMGDITADEVISDSEFVSQLKSRPDILTILASQKLIDRIAFRSAFSPRDLTLLENTSEGRTLYRTLQRNGYLDQAMLNAVSVNTPQKFAGVLTNNHDLKVKGVQVQLIKGNGNVQTLLNDPARRYIVESSSAAALGSYFLRGLGKKTKGGLDIKIAGDGNALKLIEDETLRFVTENDGYAVIELASEGARDGSVSSPVGRIYHKDIGGVGLHYIDTVEFEFDENGKVKRIKSFDVQKFSNAITGLIERGVKVMAKITDSLEKTEGLVDPKAKDQPTDSWALNSVIFIGEGDQIPHPIEDNMRRVAITYNAPKRASIGPMDMPSDIIPKIAEANGIKLWNDVEKTEMTKEYKTWLETVQLTLLGPRGIDLKNLESGDKRHLHFIDDMNAFMKEMNEKHGVQLYDAKENKGLRLSPVTDGDLMPRLMSLAGPMELNDHRYHITIGRSGSAEAQAARAFAATVKDAHMVSRLVSTKSTANRVAYDTADNYTDEEKRTLSVLRYKEGDEIKVYNDEESQLETIVGMTAVTGATDHLGRNFRDTMTSVNHNPLTKTLSTRTLVSDTEGNVYAVEVEYGSASNDLSKSIKSILSRDELSADIVKELPNIVPFNGGLTFEQATETYRRPQIGYNYKGAFKKADVERILEGLAEDYQRDSVDASKAQIIAIFAFEHLDRARQKIDALVKEKRIPKGYILLGAQDVRPQGQGAYTGHAPSIDSLKDLGVEVVLVGHSELTTAVLGDKRIVQSDQEINERLKIIIANGLQPILAYGETLDQREAGQTKTVLESQLENRLAGIDAQDIIRSNLIAAYEPVWAIGGTKSATKEEAQGAMQLSRQWLYDNKGAEAAARTPFQYGGSMNKDNVEDLSTQPDIDGGLIGSASLETAKAVPIYRTFAKNTKQPAGYQQLFHGQNILKAINPNIERGYDVRGTTTGANTTMTPELLYTAGVAFGLELKARLDTDGRRPRVLITGDQRQSTPALREAVIRGLASQGIDADFSDEWISTPGSNVIARLLQDQYDAAVQITASHNAWTKYIESEKKADGSYKEHDAENGFKLSIRDENGHLRGVYGKEMAAILSRAFSLNAIKDLPESEKGQIKKVEFLNLYYDHLQKLFEKQLTSLGLDLKTAQEKLVLVVDSGNALMGPIAKSVIQDRLGITYVGIHDDVITNVDGIPAHEADPSKSGTYKGHLDNEVQAIAARAENKDKIVIGLAFDGDGDRIGMTDENGLEYLNPNKQGYFFFSMMRKQNPKASVVLDIRAGQEMLEMLGLSEEDEHWHAPGWPIVRKAIQDADAEGAVEASHHTMLRQFEDRQMDAIDDGLYGGLFVAAQALKLAQENSSIHNLLDRPWYPSLTEELRPKVSEAKAGERYDIMPKIAAEISQKIKSAYEGARIREIPSPGEQGAVRLQISDNEGKFIGWILIRASNTQPKLSMQAQGKDQTTIVALASTLKDVLAQFPQVNQEEVTSALDKTIKGDSAQLGTYANDDQMEIGTPVRVRRTTDAAMTQRIAELLIQISRDRRALDQITDETDYGTRSALEQNISEAEQELEALQRSADTAMIAEAQMPTSLEEFHRIVEIVVGLDYEQSNTGKTAVRINKVKNDKWLGDLGIYLLRVQTIGEPSLAHVAEEAYRITELLNQQNPANSAMLSNAVIEKAAFNRIGLIKDEIVTIDRVMKLAKHYQAKTLQLNRATGDWINKSVRGYSRFAKNGTIIFYGNNGGTLPKQEKDDIKVTWHPEGASHSRGFIISRVNFIDMISELAENDIQAARTLIREVELDLDSAMLEQAGVLQRINPIQTASWKEILALANRDKYDLRKMFAQDPQRAERLLVELNPHVDVDFSKNLIDDQALKALLGLAKDISLSDAIEKMFTGQKINETENRAVLHTALRNVKRDATGKLVAVNGPVMADGQDVMPGVIAVLEKMEAFTKKVQSGEWKGASGKKIKNIINVGIGGSDLGPKMGVDALKPFKAGDVDAYFLSNIDGTAAAELMNKLDPTETLVIIVSKTFTTQETVQNAETLKNWVLNAYKGDESVIKKHFVAVSTAKDLVAKFGIDTENMFEFWDWVGGRYSMWSAVGLAMATYIGFDNFLQFLEGGREADEHFRAQPFEKNIPVLKALLNVWYGNFLGAETFAILPYDQYLGLFPSFAQQFFMESNGKSVGRDGKFVDYQTGLIAWGAAGTDGQHSFYQLIHQGTRLIPADFIGIMRSHNALPGHHDKLFSNYVAQTEALAFGATQEEVRRELANDPKYAGKDLDWNAAQQTFTGNKPTTSILVDQMTPRTLGNLVALYEQQIFVEGVIWNIFSFDQWGVQLGKVVATKKVLPFLDGSRSLDQLESAGVSPSAARTIRRYVAAKGNSAMLTLDSESIEGLIVGVKIQLKDEFAQAQVGKDRRKLRGLVRGLILEILGERMLGLEFNMVEALINGQDIGEALRKPYLPNAAIYKVNSAGIDVLVNGFEEQKDAIQEVRAAKDKDAMRKGVEGMLSGMYDNPQPMVADLITDALMEGRDLRGALEPYNIDVDAAMLITGQTPLEQEVVKLVNSGRFTFKFQGENGWRLEHQFNKDTFITQYSPGRWAIQVSGFEGKSVLLYSGSNSRNLNFTLGNPELHGLVTSKNENPLLRFLYNSKYYLVAVIEDEALKDLSAQLGDRAKELVVDRLSKAALPKGHPEDGRQLFFISKSNFDSDPNKKVFDAAMLQEDILALQGIYDSAEGKAFIKTLRGKNDWGVIEKQGFESALRYAEYLVMDFGNIDEMSAEEFADNWEKISRGLSSILFSIENQALPMISRPPLFEKSQAHYLDRESGSDIPTRLYTQLYKILGSKIRLSDRSKDTAMVSSYEELNATGKDYVARLMKGSENLAQDTAFTILENMALLIGPVVPEEGVNQLYLKLAPSTRQLVDDLENDRGWSLRETLAEVRYAVLTATDTAYVDAFIADEKGDIIEALESLAATKADHGSLSQTTEIANATKLDADLAMLIDPHAYETLGATINALREGGMSVSGELYRSLLEAAEQKEPGALIGLGLAFPDLDTSFGNTVYQTLMTNAREDNSDALIGLGHIIRKIGELGPYDAIFSLLLEKARAGNSAALLGLALSLDKLDSGERNLAREVLAAHIKDSEGPTKLHVFGQDIDPQPAYLALRYLIEATTIPKYQTLSDGSQVLVFSIPSIAGEKLNNFSQDDVNRIARLYLDRYADGLNLEVLEIANQDQSKSFGVRHKGAIKSKISNNRLGLWLLAASFDWRLKFDLVDAANHGGRADQASLAEDLEQFQDAVRALNIDFDSNEPIKFTQADLPKLDRLEGIIRTVYQLPGHTRTVQSTYPGYPNVTDERVFEAFRSLGSGALKMKPAQEFVYYIVANANSIHRWIQNARDIIARDSGMLQKNGGIDLNPAMLNTEIKKEGGGVNIPANLQSIESMRNIPGLEPNIINIVPVIPANLPIILGIKLPQKEKDTDISYNLSSLPMDKREVLGRELEEVSK